MPKRAAAAAAEPWIDPALNALLIPIDSVTPHPSRSRVPAEDALVASLRDHGQYRPIVVNRRTKHVIVRRGIWAAAKTLGWPTIAATWVDVDPTEELAILVTDDRLNDRASYDDTQLLGLLQRIEEPDALARAGYTPDDVDDLLARAGQDTRAYSEPNAGYAATVPETNGQTHAAAGDNGTGETGPARAPQREILLVFSATDHAAWERDIATLRRCYASPSATAAVLEALRIQAETGGQGL